MLSSPHPSVGYVVQAHTDNDHLRFLALTQFNKVNTFLNDWNRLAPYTMEFHDTVNDTEKVDTSIKIKKHYLKDEKNPDFHMLAKVSTLQL